MAKYKLLADGVLLRETGQLIPENPSERHWQKYLEWVAEGNTPDPIHTDDELLEQARVFKRAELHAAYELEANVPVLVNGYTYPCGEEAAIDLDHITRAAKLLGQTDCDVPDIDGIDRLLTLNQADDVLKAMIQQVKPLAKKRRKLYRDVAIAANVATVNAITW